MIDLSGKLALLVLAPSDYAEGTDGIRAERDQGELPLSASDIVAGMGLERQRDEVMADLDARVEKSEKQLQEAQRQQDQQVNKEFGDFDYDDAKQLIVLKANGKPFKAHWAQARLSISSDQATSLLLRLLDDQVIAVDTEGETALDHSYKVIATLEDVVV